MLDPLPETSTRQVFLVETLSPFPNIICQVVIRVLRPKFHLGIYTSSIKVQKSTSWLLDIADEYKELEVS